MYIKKNLVAATAAVLAAGMALAGCGSSTEAAATSRRPPTAR